jgi:ribosomal protein S18 acetylase RimI-like enzyme
VGNEAAMRLYERMGYRRMKVAENFYARGMDAFLYEKPLVKSG